MIVKFVWFVGFICLPLFISGCDSSKDVSVGVCIFHEQCSDKGHVYITNNCSRVSHEAIDDYIASRGWNKGFNTTSTGKCFYVGSGGLTLNSLGCSMRELRVGGLLVAMSKLAKAIRSSIKVFAVTNSVTGKVIEGILEEASLEKRNENVEYNCAIMYMPKSGRFQSMNIE